MLRGVGGLYVAISVLGAIAGTIFFQFENHLLLVALWAMVLLAIPVYAVLNGLAVAVAALGEIVVAISELKREMGNVRRSLTSGAKE
jgi:hypothetical protein